MVRLNFAGSNPWSGFVLTATLASVAACTAAPRELDKSPWIRREIAVGVDWHRIEKAEVRGTCQTVHVLELDPAKNGAVCKLIVFETKARTSAGANAAGALAAVNGGYFDTAGAPVGYVRFHGRDTSSAPGTRPARGAVGFDADGELDFRRVGAGESWEEVADALGAGPMLVAGGRVQTDFAAEGFKDVKFLGRNPRTAIGVTPEKRVLLVTVDGRQEGSAGMSLDELAEFMAAIGCQEALNLDGGGSTTCWIRGKGAGGVVNHPSDATGERAVANAIGVAGRRVYIVDNDPKENSGVDTPAGRFRAIGEHRYTLSTSGDGFLGSNYAFGLGPAQGEWSVRVDEPGRYEVFARWPRGHFTAVAEYELHGLTQAYKVRVDQRAGFGEWFPLGFVSADASTPIRITVKSTTVDPVAADAVRVVEAESRAAESMPAR